MYRYDGVNRVDGLTSFTAMEPVDVTLVAPSGNAYKGRVFPGQVVGEFACDATGVKYAGTFADTKMTGCAGAW